LLRIELVITVKQADITTLVVDVIVNAANQSLLGGGGVDGAIHRTAGPKLVEACRKLGGCAAGDAKNTPGYNLPSNWVIHTVGPVWHGGELGEVEQLRACYQNSLNLAKENKFRTIAFPAISTGVYGFPIDRATIIAVQVMRKFQEDFEEIICCCFSERDTRFYIKALR